MVRRAVQGSPSTKNFDIRHFEYSKNSHGHRYVAAACPPLPGPNEVEVPVVAFGLVDLEDEAPLTAFVGTVDGRKVLGYSYQKLINTVVVDKKAIAPLSESVSITDAVSLPAAILSRLDRIGRSRKDREGFDRSGSRRSLSYVSPFLCPQII